jgi:hypothetical protein
MIIYHLSADKIAGKEAIEIVLLRNLLFRMTNFRLIAGHLKLLVEQDGFFDDDPRLFLNRQFQDNINC